MEKVYRNKDYINDLVLRGLRLFPFPVAFYVIVHNLENYWVIAASILISTGIFGLLSLLIKKYGVEHPSE